MTLESIPHQAHQRQWPGIKLGKEGRVKTFKAITNPFEWSQRIPRAENIGGWNYSICLSDTIALRPFMKAKPPASRKINIYPRKPAGKCFETSAPLMASLYTALPTSHVPTTWVPTIGANFIRIRLAMRKNMGVDPQLGSARIAQLRRRAIIKGFTPGTVCWSSGAAKSADRHCC